MRSYEFIDEGFIDAIKGGFNKIFGNKETIKSLTIPSGKRGPEVADIQKVLKAAGYGQLLGPYGDGGVDGIRGKFTTNAIATFQKDHNIKPTGIPDQETIGALNSLLVKYPNLPKSTSKDIVSGQPEITAGSNSWSGGKYPYKDIIEATAAKYGFPAWALAGLIAQESNFNPHSIGDNGNSWGMGQFNRRGAAAEYHLSRDEILSMTPEQQISYIGDFLNKKIKQAGGSVWGGLKLYNGGGDPNYVQNIQTQLQKMGMNLVT